MISSFIVPGKMDCFTVLFFLSVSFRLAWSQCPPKTSIPNCDCAVLEGGAEKLRVVCSGVKLADVSSIFRNLGPLDLTLQNGGFSALSGQFSTETSIGKLTLLNNGLERISAGDFKSPTPLMRELSISEPGLKLVDDMALNDIPSLQRFTLSDSTVLERFPKLKGLSNLVFVSFTNNSVRFLEAGTLSELPALREIDLRSNKIEIFDISTFGELDNVRRLDLTGNALSDLSFLPLVLRNLPNLNVLFLQSNQISKIPLGIFDGLNAILTVDFSKNQINKLPDTMSTNASSTLRELYLGHNYITEIPPTFFEHVPNLRTLSFANNSLNVLDTQLGPLKDLLYLRLEGNKLQRIVSQAFSTLARLQTLSLEGNQLTVLENSVFSGMNELLTLDLSRNYIQEFHGTEIKNLTKLETLLFNGNKLRNLYAGFESLVALKRLDLSNNQISNIDDNTLANLTSLEILQLEGNLFMKLPMSALEKLPVLEKLTLSNNRLLRLPVLKKIGHLKYLSLDHNTVPDIAPGTFQNLPELRQLLLNDNRISIVGENAFASLYALYVLDLSGNIIQTVNPKVFDNLVSLESLNLSNNDLSRLSDNTLGNLPMLRSVDFSHNQIGYVSDGAFQNVPHLMQFDISRNVLNIVPAAIARLGKVRKVDLSSNRIRRIENGNFTKLDKLENLNLQRNPLCYLGDKAFTDAVGLTYLDLSQTDLRQVPQTAFRSSQDFAGVMLDGVAIDCDCNSKWLRLLKPNLRCGFPGAVLQMKVSQINPEFMTCQVEEKGSLDRTCTVLPVPARRVGGGPGMAVTPPSGGGAAAAGVTALTDPDTQVLAKGSMTNAWPSRAEIEAKSQELDAIQAARQIRNAGCLVERIRFLSVFSFVIAVLLIQM